MRTIAGVTLVLFFVFVTTVTAVLFNLQQVMSDPDEIKEAAKGRRLLDSAVATLIRHDLRDQPIFHEFPVVLRNSPALATAIDSLISDDWADAQSDQVVEAFFRYLENGQISELTIKLEVAPLWSQLRGDVGRQIVATTLESLPICSLDQLPELDLATGQIELTVCMPPLVPVDLIAGELHAVVSDLIDEKTVALVLGDVIEFNLIDLDPAPRSQTIKTLEEFRLIYIISRPGVWLLWIVPFVTLVIIILVAVRSLSDFGLWVGGSLLLTSLALFAVAVAARPLVPVLVFGQGTALVEWDVAGRVIDGVLRTMLAILIQKWQARVFLQSGLFFFSSIGLLGLGILAYLSRVNRGRSVATTPGDG